MESEFLRCCVRRYSAANERLDAMSAGLTDRQANWRPATGSWSIGECLEHMALSAGSYADRMEAAIAAARRQGRRGDEEPGRGTLIGKWILGALRQGPGGRRLKAPGVFRPRRVEFVLADSVLRLRGVHLHLCELAERADGLPLGRIRIATPLSPLLRVSLAQAFEMHALHAHRHLDQVERIIADAGFPR